MKATKVLQNYVLVKPVQIKNTSSIIMPASAMKSMRTTFGIVVDTYGEYHSYGIKHVPKYKKGDIVMMLTGLDGNIEFEQDGETVSFVPDNALLAVVEDIELEDSDENSTIISG